MWIDERVVKQNLILQMIWLRQEMEMLIILMMQMIRWKYKKEISDITADADDTLET